MAGLRFVLLQSSGTICPERADGTAEGFGVGLWVFVQVIPLQECCTAALSRTAPRLGRASGHGTIPVPPGMSGEALVGRHLLAGASVKAATQKWTLYWCRQCSSAISRRKPSQGEVVFLTVCKVFF